MIIIIDKNELMGRRAELARVIPLEDLDIFDVVDSQKVTLQSIQTSNIFIVTDYAAGKLRIMKHRYNEHLHDRILPIGELDRAIEDEIAVGTLSWSEEDDG